MRLNREAGYHHDVNVPYGKTAVMFMVEGGPANCEVYRRDGSGAQWILVKSKLSNTVEQITTIDVMAGWWIRIRIDPQDQNRAAQTRATVSFYPLK